MSFICYIVNCSHVGSWKRTKALHHMYVTYEHTGAGAGTGEQFKIVVDFGNCGKKTRVFYSARNALNYAIHMWFKHGMPTPVKYAHARFSKKGEYRVYDQSGDMCVVCANDPTRVFDQRDPVEVFDAVAALSVHQNPHRPKRGKPPIRSRRPPPLYSETNIEPRGPQQPYGTTK